MFIFTDFVGSQLKELFEYYKRLKFAKRKEKNNRYYATRSYKNKQRSKNMMLSGKELQAKNTNNKDRQKEYLAKHLGQTEEHKNSSNPRLSK